ncbi:MAG: hypothetical protein K1X94_03080 [Sandaracinaceae bacterium]|nr:hypothetical protein [Sandaracinaceae bacterium]
MRRLGKLGLAALAPLAVALLASGALVSGCLPPRRASLGGECEINSQCDAPLVCRLGYCRNECATSEDCGAGQSCVLDLDKLGVCQLPTETHCTLATDCPPSLVCRFEQCVNACETDRDCLGGARCVVDPAGNACLDVGVVPCVFDGDCGYAESCLAGRCRPQCHTDRDCRRGLRCNEGYCGERPDAGPIDAGGPDAATLDTGGLGVDTGPVDAAMGTASCGGGLPSPADTWPATGVDPSTSVLVVAAGHVILNTVTNRMAGPGGTLEVLDVASGTWAHVPFPESRLRMSAVAEGSVVYLTGGTWSTPGGDPLRDIVTYDVSTGVFGALGVTSSEARAGGAMTSCAGRLIVAGGDPYNATGTGSTAIDLVSIATHVAETAVLPEPFTSLSGASSATHAYFGGGVRNLMYGMDFASDRLFDIDCASGTTATVAMPHFFAGTAAAILGHEVFFTGRTLPDGSTYLSGASFGVEVVDVYDVDLATWRTLAAPRPFFVFDPVPTSAVVPHRFVRAFADATRGELQVLDVTTGRWDCTNVSPIRALAADASAVYALGGFGTSATVTRWVLP